MVVGWQPSRRSHRAAWCLAIMLVAGDLANCQLSKPVAHDKHWDEQTHNKFLQRTADNDKDTNQ